MYISIDLFLNIFLCVFFPGGGGGGRCRGGGGGVLCMFVCCCFFLKRILKSETAMIAVYIRTKHNMRVFWVIPFITLQTTTYHNS